MDLKTILPYLKKVVWNYEFTDEELLNIFEGKLNIHGGYNQQWMFRKLLQYYNWYTLLSFIPIEWLPSLLAEEVVKGVFPKSLQEKYRYAGRFLSKHPLSKSDT